MLKSGENVFDGRHPFAVFLYYAVIIFVTMFVSAPPVPVISLFSAVSALCIYIGVGPAFKTVAFLLPFAALAALLNPLFVHSGKTVLFFFLKTPITLQALLYGINMGLMIMAAALHFKCLSVVLTMDKMLYLLGKAFPDIVLVICMAVKNVAVFGKKLRDISDAQRALGYFGSEKGFAALKKRAAVFSALITGALEDSAETAVSMRSKGYGIKKRVNSTVYRYNLYDGIFTCITLILSLSVFYGMFSGAGEFEFYPVLTEISFDFVHILFYSAFCLLAFLPGFLKIGGVLRERRICKSLSEF